MEVRIIDPLGIETGVRIDNVRAVYDVKKRKFSVFGIMIKRDYYYKYEFEPELVCNVYDVYDKIIICKQGNHFGDFCENKKTSFSIIINDFDVDSWRETKQIKISVIFIRR